MFPVEYGIASAEQAEKVFSTELSPPIVTDYGPRVGDMGVGDIAWVYNRWNMVHALYNYGRSEQAFELLKKFVAQESGSDCHYQGPEAYTPEGATTSQGLVWSSCRAMRAIYFGLIGLSLEGEGVRFKPKPPSNWPGFTLRNLEVRGGVIDLTVNRGSKAEATCDGKPIVDGLVPNSMLTPGSHKVVLTMATPR